MYSKSVFRMNHAIADHGANTARELPGNADGDETGGHPEAQGGEMGSRRRRLPHGGHLVRANGTGNRCIRRPALSLLDVNGCEGRPC